ncbi:peripheral-type benzodiazepine receptor-associated protein 1-like [Apteryx rowi]|uniref:peripheral-type benzodiazepine receptor-associated protein 1-like n=1 Tax=Apteryx rowi TaxID=308060 RepID=UPI000E1CE751|nr:peripheral-type benzodiazepine receptor-associated protein 1-like [Apteryx rowi]
MTTLMNGALPMNEAARGGEARGRLQDVLGKLRWDTDGDQAAHIRHLQNELQLERSLFAKYILERFEGELPASPCGAGAAAWRGPQALLGGRTPRPCSWESLITASTPDGGGPRALAGAGSQIKPRSVPGEEVGPAQSALEESHAESPCAGQWMARKGLKDAHLQEERDSIELLPEAMGEDLVLHCPDSPPEGKPGSRGPVGEGSIQRVGQQEDWLLDSRYRELVEQNTHLQSALKDLEKRCNDLQNKNCLLRKRSFPEVREQVKRLKQKNAELAVITKQLEERSRQLQETNRKVINTPIPLPIQSSSVELCMKSFAQQRAKEMREHTRTLLVKDKQIEVLQKKFWELQAKLAADKEGSYCLSFSDFSHLLSKSQKEALCSQRQIAVRNLKKSLNSSKSVQDVSSPMCLVPKTVATSMDSSLDGSSLSKETQTEIITLAKDTESVELLLETGSEKYENTTLKTNQVNKQQREHLGVELGKKLRQHKNLEQEVSKKQKRCEELEVQLTEMMNENARLAKENSQLSGKTEWTEKVQCENADLKVKLMQVTEERNSAIQATNHLQTKLEDLECELKDMREIAERKQQLENEYEETKLALQKKEEKVKHLQRAQVEVKVAHEEVMQQFQAQVRELKNQYQNQTEQYNLLSQELEQLKIKKSNHIISELPRVTCFSTTQTYAEDAHDLCCSENSSDTFEKPTKALATPTSTLKSDSTQDSPRSCLISEEDAVSEPEESVTDKHSLILESPRQQPAKLRVFLARYSYDPYDGPNKHPEVELPLTAGEYIYIFGDMDEDGFFEGELMDGRRGLVPSNLIEEVSDDDLMMTVPPDPSDFLQNADHEVSFCSRSVRNGGKNDGLEEGICVSGLADRPGDTEIPLNHAAVPYPRNLTLIKQFARSIIIGWEPPLVLGVWEEVQNYNISVDTECSFCSPNVRFSSETQAVIEDLDLKNKTYRISVQSVTEKGNSDKMQCTILVGKDFHIAPECLKLRSITPTSAEVTWMPSSSNYLHAVYLNERDCDIAKPGVYWYTFQSLQPNTQYEAKVEAWPKDMKWHVPQKSEQNSATFRFVTPSAGVPHAPLDVQVEPGPSVNALLISWLPVTIDAEGSSNGVQVTGYAVYINGQRVKEIACPTAGSALVDLSHVEVFQVSQKVSVRTLSPYGESVDSVPALIPPALLSVPSCSCLPKSTSVRLTPGKPHEEFPGSQTSTHSTSSFSSSQVCIASQDARLTMHFTDNCCDSVTSPPSNVYQNQFSHSSVMMHELTTLPLKSCTAKNEDDNECLQAYQQAEVSAESSRLSFPATWREESLGFKTSEDFVEDVQRNETEKHCVLKSNLLENLPVTSNINKSRMVHYVDSDNSSVEFSIARDAKEDDGACLSSIHLYFSQLELEKVSSRDTGTNQFSVQEIQCDSTDKKQIRELSEEVSSVGRSKGEKEEGRTSRMGNWKLNYPDYHSHSYGLSDILEEEEGLDLVSEEIPLQNYHYLSVALFDCDPISMSPDFDAAEDELPFKERQVIKATGDKDTHDFCGGEYAGKAQYISYNVVVK